MIPDYIIFPWRELFHFTFIMLGRFIGFKRILKYEQHLCFSGVLTCATILLPALQQEIRQVSPSAIAQAVPWVKLEKVWTPWPRAHAAPELKQTRTKPWRARIFWAHQHHFWRVWITQGGIEEVQRSFQKLTRRMGPDNLSLETLQNDFWCELYYTHMHPK